MYVRSVTSMLQLVSENGQEMHPLDPPVHIQQSDRQGDVGPSAKRERVDENYGKRQNELYSRFCILFSESSIVESALSPGAKPHCTVHFVLKYIPREGTVHVESNVLFRH